MEQQDSMILSSTFISVQYSVAGSMVGLALYLPGETGPLLTWWTDQLLSFSA